MGGLDAGVAREVGSQLETMIGESFVVLLPNCDDLDRRWKDPALAGKCGEPSELWRLMRSNTKGTRHGAGNEESI